jgi:hypothetical protein
MASENFAQIEYDDIVAETPSAILISIDDRDVWIPKSQIEFHNKDSCYMEIPEWLAIDKELV